MKEYWKSVEELRPSEDNTEVKKSSYVFNEEGDATASTRRDFLKIFGFSIASAAVLASCERPVKKAIPLLIQPEEIRPGTANYYASTFYDGTEAIPILIKVRDGRPIKIEGNDLCLATRGAASARAQASLLNLYDKSRPAEPSILGKIENWDIIDGQIIKKLNEWDNTKSFVLLTPTVLSPSTLQLIEDFKTKYPFTSHVTFDAISYSALREANLLAYNKAIIPTLRFDKAKLVVGFNADFLGTWLQPITFSKQYSTGRKLTNGEKDMMRHVQFEATMSLTGSNADERVPMAAFEEGAYLASLYSILASKAGKITNTSGASDSIKAIAAELWSAKGKSLVVSGTNDVNIQVLVCSINQLLNNNGTTVLLNEPINLFKGDDRQIETLINDSINNKVGGILFWQTNPVYHYPAAGKMADAIKNIPLKIAVSSLDNETATLCDYQLPAPHSIESWDDAELSKGLFTLTQPAIRPLFNTRSPQDNLIKWASFDGEFYDYLKLYWKENIYTMSLASGRQFEAFWKTSLRDGIIYDTNKNADDINASTTIDVNKALSNIKTSPTNELELVLYQNVPIGDGTLANNPWLQELPDPVSRVCWDNYVAISPAFATLRGLEQGDLLKVNDIELPILIQPGQARNTLAIAVGYGRRQAGKVATNLGKDVYPFVTMLNGHRCYLVSKVEVLATGGTYQLAATQSHHSMEGRPLVRETTLKEYLENPAAGNELHAELEEKHTTLYSERKYNGHHWGMVIDLNSCTGCNACVVACSAENNVPVVGRDEVRRSHEMQWLRIDRYYAGDEDNPEVVRQPVMCQHCDNAPCENVCPVAATNHSSEGLNQMVYNRCIGTRYCNNNCPYKVRRFNWYDYTGADSIPNNRMDVAGMTMDLKRMVLNPDVVVRAKGVIEKCSLCVQRIQEKKLDAKKEGHPLADGAIKTACQQTCPANAITFGDVNDKDSKVAKLLTDARQYGLLEDLHTLPSVVYLTKVRNKELNKS